MSRPNKNATFLEIAETLSRRSTCARRQVGCVLVNEHHHIVGCGYNGVGANLSHCTDKPCQGAGLASGTGLDKCEAIHAEQNALLQCKDVQSIHTAYITCSPCMHCAKLFLNTGVKEIVFTGAEAYDTHAIWMLADAGIKMFQLHEGELHQW